MTKRRSRSKLTIYRRHNGKCPVEETSDLQHCDCPLWIRGVLRGKPIKESLETRSDAAAMLKRNRMLDEEEEGDQTPSASLHLVGKTPKEKITLEAAVEDFYASKKTKSASTTKVYTHTVDEFSAFVEAKGVLLLREVDKTHVQDYFAEIAKDWTRNTKQSRLTFLRVFFNYCCRERRWIDHAPTASRDLNFKRTKGGKGVRLPLTPEEVTKVLEAVDLLPEKHRDRARALILLLLCTGMRISDATFIERDSIDASGNLCYWVIKTRRELECSLWLRDEARAALEKLPPSHVYFFHPDRDDHYLPARQALRNGQDFTQAMPDYHVRVRKAAVLVTRVLRLAGLTGACHRFRDTFAVSLLEGDVDIYVVCQFLGHSDVRITQQHYIKFIPGYRERMAQRTRALAYQFPLAG